MYVSNKILTSLSRANRTDLGKKRRIGSAEFKFEWERQNKLRYSASQPFATKDEAERACIEVTDHVALSVGLFMKHDHFMIVEKEDRKTGTTTYSAGGVMTLELDDVLNSI